MRDVTVTKATGPFAHQTLTHAPLQTRVGRAHRTPDTLPAALHPTTRACTKPVLTQVWITRHSLALKPHVSWKQYERWWSFAGSDYWSLLSRDSQPATNKQTNKKNKKNNNTQPETNQPTNSRIKKKKQLRLWGDAVQRPQVWVMTDSPAGGWSPLCDSGLLTDWAISEQTHQQTLNYVLPKRRRDWSAAGNPNLTCCR